MQKPSRTLTQGRTQGALGKQDMCTFGEGSFAKDSLPFALACGMRHVRMWRMWEDKWQNKSKFQILLELPFDISECPGKAIRTALPLNPTMFECLQDRWALN